MAGPSHQPLPARLGLWRITRNDAIRELYRRLASDGRYFAQLDLFERPGSPPPEVPPAPIDGFHDRRVADLEEVPDPLGDDPLAPDDRLVTAVRDGERVGRCCLSDRQLYVPELHRRITFPGAYLWRVYVPPAERGQGIGTAIVAEAVSLVAETDAEAVCALIGPDNLPSRAAFRSVGFEPTERYTAAGLFGWDYDRRSALEDPADQSSE